MPSDTTFDKDEIEDALPDDVKDEIVKDFIESGDAQDKTEITDEMIENPVSKSDADYVKNVYETGLKEGERLAQTGDLVPLCHHRKPRPGSSGSRRHRLRRRTARARRSARHAARNRKLPRNGPLPLFAKLFAKLCETCETLRKMRKAWGLHQKCSRAWLLPL